jgi:hypothetical protein
MANEFLKKEKELSPTLGALAGFPIPVYLMHKRRHIITGINEALYLGLNRNDNQPNWVVGAAMKWEVCWFEKT